MIKTIELLTLSDEKLTALSRELLLALTLEEMKEIQKYFVKKGRNPSDIELETLAQTWSEHCKHKTLTGFIEYTESIPEGYLKLLNAGEKKRVYDNLLKQTVFRATMELDKKWCISVFKDNAGIIDFDERSGVAFKVETHNHPSALEPYGGAGTGIGGVIRDILGVGLGAKPILNTDVFCFGPLDFSHDRLPKGVLHPKRIFKGVVAGVRDYGNRMGIPTGNGAVLFDESYLGNPLVFCGTLGLIPRDKCEKQVNPGDMIVSVGGRTGRDGIHGATFSSLELDKDTPLSPVQIGNPIVEKKVTDTVLQARDAKLYTAITDCGAGGFSSAIGELGSECGARVYLDRAPLKYAGLEPWEIWVSEAQERMVLAVPRENLEKLLAVFEREDVEASVLGEFTSNGKLEVFYKDEKLCELDMSFMHDGVPRNTRQAYWKPTINPEPELELLSKINYGKTLKALLARPNVCSKDWIVRQYDHEVQGQTVMKPFVGKNEGPSDACVIYPYAQPLKPGQKAKKSFRGIVVANGINPNYSKIDAYWMAASVIDEALRNIIAAGGDIETTAILDNYCWGNCARPEQMGSIVRASQACYDIAKEYGVPFISGKDSLNNEFRDENGEARSILPTLLISAVSVIPDIRKIVTIDLKKPGNLLYLVGETKNELGASQLYEMLGATGNSVPTVKAFTALNLMKTVSAAINKGVVESCHDCSDGGLAVSVAEMAFAGGLGAEIRLKDIPVPLSDVPADVIALFSESNSRFVVEVKPSNKKKFEKIFAGVKVFKIGKVEKKSKLNVFGTNGKKIISEDITVLKDSWESYLKNV